MLVFLSWSGDRSKAVAEILQQWLQEVIQAVEPWMSLDIEKGGKWIAELNDKLEQSKVGILCITSTSLNSPWMFFEAGALAKTKDALVCNLLINVPPEEITYPLAQFQSTSVDKGDMRRLIRTINSAVLRNGEKGLSESVLDRLFDLNWNRLEQQLEESETRGYDEDYPPLPPYQPLDLVSEMIGLELAKADEKGCSIEELTPKVLRSIRPDLRIPTPTVLALMASQYETKHLARLIEDGLVEEQGDRFSLTIVGKSYFAGVEQRLKTLQDKMLPFTQGA